MDREKKNLLETCRYYGLNNRKLAKRMQTILKYRNLWGAHKGIYERDMRSLGQKKMAVKLRDALYSLADLDIEKSKERELKKNIILLSGSGLLDSIIEDSISVAVSQYPYAGEKFYRPILTSKYDGYKDESWITIQQLVSLSESHTYERHNEALLATGLALCKAVLSYYAQLLMTEEGDGEHEETQSEESEGYQSCYEN